MKTNIFKSFILMFFSACFLACGILLIAPKREERINAETSLVESVENNVQDYVSIDEYLNGSVVSNSPAVNDIFLYNQNNSLKIALKANGGEVNANGGEIYDYVYYPDPNNLSFFYFYRLNNASLSINGETQSFDYNNFVTNAGSMTFANLTDVVPETFEINFGSGDGENTFNILDDNNQLREGLYTLHIEVDLWWCNGGRSDQNEDRSSFNEMTDEITYSFFVLNESSYLSGRNVAFVKNRPVFQHENFDSASTIATTVNPDYGNYLYSNYSYAGNKIASLTYDQTRYDVTITKDLNSVTYTTTLSYIAENDTGGTSGYSVTGDDIIRFEKRNNLTTIYFYDVGNYSVSFDAVATFPVLASSGESTSTYNKYSLPALADATKGVMVYVYGYQATHIDYDNNGEYVEFKIYENDNGKFDGAFYHSADITANFLASNSAYGQNASSSDTTGGQTFVYNNILSYINDNGISPETTDQAVVRFNSNATLASGIARSYIYTTTRLNSSYTKVEGALLNGEDVYYSTFDNAGSSISDPGTYVVLLAYTFNQFYTQTNAQRDANTVFYQVFYFKLDTRNPAISAIDENGKVMSANTFTNKSVTITNPNIDGVHNRDITLRVYAQDYTTDTTDNYISTFGGVNGVDMRSLTDGDTLTVDANAKYTLRLYYTSEMSDTNINTINNQILQQVYFTIDNTEITGITARNVSLISGTTRYSVLDAIAGVSTNQSIVVSWNEKDSGAVIEAYYRYFPIVNSDFYGNNTSRLLESFLNGTSGVSYLPNNYSLDLSSGGVSARYAGNTLGQSTTTSQYLISSQGLYVFEIFDSAGNRSIEIFIIDKTSPLFALQTGDEYSLVPSYHYISETSTLYWGDYKTLAISDTSGAINFNSVDINSVQESAYNFDVYKDHNGVASLDIYTAFYDLFRAENNIQFIYSDVFTDTRTRPYLTFKIDDLVYETQNGSNNYTSANYAGRAKSTTLEVANTEYTYRILIRDESNEAYDRDSSLTSPIQYTRYYSARQNVTISFDTSEFRIYYQEQNSAGEMENVYLASNLMEVSEDGTTLTTYLSPINISDLVYVSYIPTVAEDATTVQIASVTLEYYSYIQKESTDENGITYYYRELSTSPTSTPELYVYSNVQNTTTQVDELLENDGMTSEGMYVITRTYDSSGNFDRNSDYLVRKYVLYVDRNEVISQPENINEGTTSHSESLVGGEIFVAMYDSGTNTDLVITFPDSPDGNKNSTTLRDNFNLVTNKLPLKIYVPTYKFTQYAKKVPVLAYDEDGEQMTTNEYYYEAIYDVEQNSYYNLDGTNLDRDDITVTENGNVLIDEYLLFAQIYRTSSDGTRTLLYRTTTTFDNPDPTNAESEHGFLTFYDRNGTPLEALTEAGTYTVEIYQGYGSATSFEQVSTFGFTIESTTPDFEARTTRSTPLNSTTENGRTVYHTNQEAIQLIWSVPRSSYSAQIDIEHFTVSVNGGEATVMTADELFVSHGSSQNSYYGNLNLTSIGAVEHGNYVDITMQYENHNDAYYSTVTKRILIDREAPYTNIGNLVNRVIGNFYLTDFLTYDDFRIREDANGDAVENYSETTCNRSADSGTFQFYSYAVEASFINTLKNTAQSESNYIYYKVVDKYSESHTEATYNTFRASEYSLISSLDAFASDTYYEIVESDLAGNLTIYTIYVVDYTSRDENYPLIEYTRNGEDDFFSRADYVDAKQSAHGALLSIYARPGLSLLDLNYFGNAWVVFRVDSYEDEILVPTYYLSSPWLADGMVYQITGTSNGSLTLQAVSIDSIIDGSKDSRLKDSITFYDPTRNTTESFYINTRIDTLTYTNSNSASREYISISQPSLEAINSTTTAQTYLTYMRIYSPEITGVSPEVVYYQNSNPLGYADGFASNEYVTVSTSGANIIFELTLRGLSSDTRIIYEFVDNYGYEYREMHLFGETTGYQEVSSNSTLYSFYDRQDQNNLTYITENDFIFTYNTNKYAIEIYQKEANSNVYNRILGDLTSADTDAPILLTQYVDGSILRNVYSAKATSNYSYKFRIDAYDVYEYDPELAVQTIEPKSIYFILNNQLARPDTTTTTGTTTENQFYLTSNGSNVTANVLGIGTTAVDFYSRVTLIYAESGSNFLIPIKYYLSTDNVNFEEVTSGTIISCPEEEESITYYLKVWYDMDYIMQNSLFNQLSNSEYIFELVPQSYIYEFTLTSTLQTAYYIQHTDENGETRVVERSGYTYTSPDGRSQFPNHYIVNVNYIDRATADGAGRVQIVTNTEQYVIWSEVGHYTDADNVRTYVYHISNLVADNPNRPPELTNVPNFSTDIAITYIEPTDSIVSAFYTYNYSGDININQNLISQSSLAYIVSATSSSLDQLRLEWSKYYAIKENTIGIELTKNGVSITPTIYSEIDSNGNEFYYTYITRSGSYRISFVDKSGNRMTFGKGTTSQASEFTLVFLKDIPFTLSYIDSETQEVITTEPISEATYNSDVTLTIDTNLLNYYTEQDISIAVKRNNVDYTGYTYDSHARSYTFTSPGYYSVTFSADSNVNNETIQTRTYTFTISNPDEYRYSYILNQYSNYYIEKVIKDGVDMTATYLSTLDMKTITVDGQNYLAELALSYLDEKTGAGVYTITVNSNERMYQSENTKTSWTYQVIIRASTENLIFSNTSEGATTKSTITLTFNTANVYSEFGASSVQVVHYTDAGNRVVDYSYEINAQSTGVQTHSINEANTYFIQLVSPRGIVLYSYKVIKEDPFNAATIIAIVVSIVVVIGVVVIVILLRKRIKVK